VYAIIVLNCFMWSYEHVIRGKMDMDT